MRQKG